VWRCTRWGQFLHNVGLRDLLVVQKISCVEIMAVLLLLLLLLLAVDLEVETSRTPLLWTHTSSNSLKAMLPAMLPKPGKTTKVLQIIANCNSSS